MKSGFRRVSKGMRARLSGKRTKLVIRCLAADSNPWEVPRIAPRKGRAMADDKPSPRRGRKPPLGDKRQFLTSRRSPLPHLCGVEFMVELRARGFEGESPFGKLNVRSTMDGLEVSILLDVGA